MYVRIVVSYKGKIFQNREQKIMEELEKFFRAKSTSCPNVKKRKEEV